MNEPPYLEFLYSALRSPLGIVIETNDWERCRAKLYAARRAALDPELDALSIVKSPSSDHELWIIKKGEASGEAEVS